MKARAIIVATCDAAITANTTSGIADRSSSSSSSSSHHSVTKTTTTGQAKRLRVESAPTWLKDRVENGEVLPVVEIDRGSGGEQDVVEVLVYVMKHMKKELFVDLMDLMG